MTDLELITLLIAIWGAVLSTLLGVIELIAYKRQVVVVLSHNQVIDNRKK